jgi:hypothetical protein
MTRIFIVISFLAGCLFTLLFDQAWAAAPTPQNLANDPTFWGALIGVLFFFFSTIELLKKYGLLPTRADKQVGDMDDLRRKLAPSGIPFEQSPLGKSLQQAQDVERLSHKLHDLFYNENGRLLLNKLLHDAIEPSMKPHEEAIEETSQILKKIEISDNATATQLLKIVNLLTLQNKRLRNVVKALNKIHAQEHNIPNMFQDDDDS